MPILTLVHLQHIYYVGSFPDSLLMCLKAFQQHRNIQAVRTSLSLQPHCLSLLRRLRAKTLQEVSSLAYHVFETGSVQEGLQIAFALVVPALAQIAGGDGDGVGCAREGDGMVEEVGVVEKVREEWCRCLNRPQLSEGQCTMICLVVFLERERELVA